MTSNHPDRLDPALVRPGRVDRQIELGYADRDQAARMFQWFFRDRTDCGIAAMAEVFASRLGTNVSPATIQEHLVRHRDDPSRACGGIPGTGLEVAA